MLFRVELWKKGSSGREKGSREVSAEVREA
jgi:hypothetical protein